MNRIANTINILHSAVFVNRNRKQDRDVLDFIAVWGYDNEKE